MNLTPIKTGIVGLGRSGFNIHGKLLEKHTAYKIIASCDSNKEYLKQSARKWGCNTYTSFSQFINNSELELVIVATPTRYHYEMACQAAQKGKHVVLEKPITPNLEEALSLKRQFDCKKIILAPFHNFRFSPDFVLIKSILKEKKIGDVFLIKRNVGCFNHRDDWQSQQSENGGIIQAAAIHSIDQILQLLDSDPIDIWGVVRHLISKGDAPDHAKILFKFPDDCLVDIEVSWVQALSSHPWMILGTRGAIQQNKDIFTVKYFGEDDIKSVIPEERSYLSGEKINWNLEEHSVYGTEDAICSEYYDQLALAIRKDENVPVTMDSAIRTLELIQNLQNLEL